MCGTKDKTRLKSTMYSVLNYHYSFVFNIFSAFNTLYSHNQHRISASSIYNVGAIRKTLACNFHF